MLLEGRSVPGDFAFGAGCQQPAPALYMRDGDGQSLRLSFPFTFACPALPSIILSSSVKMGGGPTPPRFRAFWHLFTHRKRRAPFPTAADGSPRPRSAGASVVSVANDTTSIEQGSRRCCWRRRPPATQRAPFPNLRTQTCPGAGHRTGAHDSSLC